MVALAVGVALGVVEPDEVGVPDSDEAALVLDGVEVRPDEVEVTELPPDEMDEVPLLNVDETTELVLLEVGCPGGTVLVLNVERVPEMTLLGDSGKEVAVLGIGNERLVSVRVVGIGVLGETGLGEGVDPLAESTVDVDRVDNDVVGKGLGVVPTVEVPGVGVDGPGELGRTLEVDPCPDEMVAEEPVGVTTVEGLSVPGTPDKLVILLLVPVDGDWLSEPDVNDAEDD